MVRIVQNDDEFTFDAPPLRLRFRWVGCRWTHELLAGGRSVAASVEWEPGRDDPTRVVSPAYQQLTAQEGEAGALALLVGQLGAHHCSAVFTVSGGEAWAAVDADVALRSRAPLQSLAGTYLTPFTSGDLADASPAAIVWGLDPPPGGRLRFEPGDGPSRVGLAEAGRRATRVQATAELDTRQATQRLRYRWRWLVGPNAL